MQLNGKYVDAGQVSVRPAQARHEPVLDRVATDQCHDWKRRGRRFGCLYGGVPASGHDHGDRRLDHRFDQIRKTPDLVVSRSEIDHDILVFDITGFTEPAPERINKRSISICI
jgi:hypothetical protein